MKKILGALLNLIAILQLHLSRVKKNPATQFFFIRFSIENLIANISLYALSLPKLNFGCYLTFEIISKALFQWKNELKKILGCWIFFNHDKCNCDLIRHVNKN